MKIVFMGTPDFATLTLKACMSEHEVIAVFTQPDKPKGRGNKLTPPPVKVIAEEKGIPVHQPVKIRLGEWPDLLRQYEPDVIVVVAYGQLLSQEILDIPKYGCINVHASLLPAYRGAAPINWAIADGHKKTGVTTMKMNAGLDTGDMLLKSEVDIEPNMTAGMLHDLLAEKGAGLLIETLNGLEEGTLTFVKQDDSLSCYASMLNKEIAKIDWSMDSDSIRNRIRGFNPWPIAHTTLEDKPLKIFAATCVENEGAALDGLSPGEVFMTDKNGIYVVTGKGLLRVDELQWGSGKRMQSQAFLLGHDITIGTKLT